MFTKPIHNTPLTGDAADRLFTNVTATGALDRTFLTTMRVLLHKRVQNDLPVQLTCKTLLFSESEIENVSATQAMKWFIPPLYSFPHNHQIIIVYTTNQNVGTKMLEMIRANCGKNKRHLASYTLLEDLRVFYARKLNALFYHCEQSRTTIIFTDRLEYKQFHALQTMFPKYVPSLFADSPLTESEAALLKSCSNKTATEYEQLVAEFAQGLDIRSELIRMKLAGFETSFERAKLDKIKEEIEDCETTYENLLVTIREVTAKIQEKQYTLTGLECAIVEHDGDSELMEYFMCNKNLSIIKVLGTCIEFVVHGYADVFDPDAFEQYVQNHNGYMYTNLSPCVTNAQMELLYRAIFGDNVYKLRLCAAYSADINGGLKAKEHYHFPPESDTYLPNPHIQIHGCIGTYAMKFQEYMRKRDYVGAIDQATVSCRNLNFHDSGVISKFMGQLSYNSSVKCIEKSDSTLITPLEAIKELERSNAPCQNH